MEIPLLSHLTLVRLKCGWTQWVFMPPSLMICAQFLMKISFLLELIIRSATNKCTKLLVQMLLGYKSIYLIWKTPQSVFSLQRSWSIGYLQSTIWGKRAPDANAVTPSSSLLGEKQRVPCLPPSQVLNGLILQAEHLFCWPPVWKTSVIKGFSFCARRWQFQSLFRAERRGERKKSFTNWCGSRNSATISLSCDEKPIRERFVNYFCLRLCAVALFRETRLCSYLFISSAGMFLLARRTMTN